MLKSLCDNPRVGLSHKVRALEVFLKKGSRELDKIGRLTTKLLDLAEINRVHQRKLRTKANEILSVETKNLSVEELRRMERKLDALRQLNGKLVERQRKVVGFKNRVATLRTETTSKLAYINLLVTEVRENHYKN